MIRRRLPLPLCALAALLLPVGCQQEETVMSVEGPDGGVEINKTTDMAGDEGLEIETD